MALGQGLEGVNTVLTTEVAQWPVKTPDGQDTGVLTSDFGIRVHPITGEEKPHYGADIGAPEGTAVVSVFSGVVIFAGWAGDGYGNLIEIQHDDGSITTAYAHLSEISVILGQRVTQETMLGRVGSTGFSTGPHLHLEVRINGEPQDPMVFINGGHVCSTSHGDPSDPSPFSNTLPSGTNGKISVAPGVIDMVSRRLQNFDAPEEREGGEEEEGRGNSAPPSSTFPPLKSLSTKEKDSQQLCLLYFDV